MSRKKLEEKEKKKKISITLDNDVYEALEDYVEKNKTKRSRLIEKLLKKYGKK